MKSCEENLLLAYVLAYQAEKKLVPNKKAALELDKFKRRLIRAVARLLLHEKKPEDQIWIELKKETGCDCELLWTRMRALTVKKLDRLLAANDCMDGIPKAARMSLSDWLLFDLVLVHQKIDLIGQNNPSKDVEDPEVLVELFELVKIFSIEDLVGDKLAEAWSSATLYYNKQGHHCSPMLLQRRWYQLKMIVRMKFYDFWYAYRGNSTRIKSAQQYRPTPLQTEVARTFKRIILQPFHDWEELIKQRLVIMPDEFERKMKERSALRRPKPKPSQDVPDLVMIEPRIETIDLRLEPDDMPEGYRKEEENPPPPLVRIKQEPQEDDMNVETQIEVPKKSMYEVVLESTHLENEQLDNMYTELYEGDLDNDENEVEEHEEAVENTVSDEGNAVLPQITNVFGNVIDTSVLANIDQSTVYRNAENVEVSDNSDDTNVACNVDDTNVCGNVDDSNVCNDKNTGLSSTVGEVIVHDNLEDITECNDGEESVSENIDDNSASGSNKDTACDNVVENNKDTGVSSKDKDTDICMNVQDISANVEETSPVIGDHTIVGDEINEISDGINEISGSDDISGNVEETSVIDNVIESSVSSNVVEPSELDVTENVPNTDCLNTQTSNTIATDNKEVVKGVENTSNPVVITDSDDDNADIVDDLIICNRNLPENTILTKDMIVPKYTIDQTIKVDSKSQVLEISFTKPSIVSDVSEQAVKAIKNVKNVEIDIKPDGKTFTFGELSNDISFADDGIEFVDDGIVYVDEDDHNHNDIETKIEFEEGTDDGPKIDEKLLMCPIIYTTRLDDMSLFLKRPYNHINDKHLLDTIALNSKPIMKEAYNDSKKTTENLTVNYFGETMESVVVSDKTKTIENVQEDVNGKPIKNDSVAERSNLIINVPGNDNSIQIKKEPANEIIEYIPKDNIKPVEQQIPENDDNVTSDDDDCDENVIDESQKVEPTSYLLQKPRSRRYNPIQLCKNPDFNTRLKRLNVGFFSSPRNRVLIKSCKPLTIDLSKAFESKLISGTLYLKPSDHNVVQEIINDKESQNVSVIPSAMPAQSLINNSKVADILPMLRNACLETSHPPEDLGSTVERNKVINLPDITEIRRINQRLLTAEVTPIQVQNNQPQVPVTIVTSINAPIYPSSKTISISETHEDLQPAEATDRRGPPKLLDITDDLPAKTITEHYSSTERNTLHAIRPSKPNLNGRPSKIINWKRVFPPKTVVWKPREMRPEIPWVTKYNDANINNRKLEETLLTLDSLNKMLFLLTDKLEPEAIPVKKPKRKRMKKYGAKQTKPLCEEPKPIDEPTDCSSCILDPSKEEETSEEQITKSQKVKINVKSATNYPPDKDKAVQKKTDDVETDGYKNKIQYCCWARQRMLQLLFCRDRIPEHECPKLCECCCRNLLKDYILEDQKIKKTELRIIKGTVNYNLGLEKTYSSAGTVDTATEKPFVSHAETASQVSDIGTVQVPGGESILVPDETSVINVEASITESISHITGNEPIDIDAMNTDVLMSTDDIDVPALGSEVCVKTTAVVAPLGARVLQIPGNKIPGRGVASIPHLEKPKTVCVTQEKGTQPYQYTHCITADNSTGGGLILNSVTKTPTTTIIQNKNSPPSLKKFLEMKKANAPNRINAKMRQPPRTYQPPKVVKEKMIFLNSKQISDKPSPHPVFLGKNKILLTTLKFPPNLKLFKQAKDALKSSLKIPKGVHLICLPNGTISYTIDNNVVVKATELAGLPSIIAAVQARMKLDKEQEEQLLKQSIPPMPVATESEIVDLVDDDDESAPNISENENKKTVTSEVQTTEDCVTVNCVDSSNDNCNAQMKMLSETEENRPESNSNVSVNLIATEKENTQVESAAAGQNTNTNIQHNIQEINQNDIPSRSTELIQDHSDPSIQNVSAEVDNILEPSVQTESTDTQEVLAEQVQEQLDPSSEIVSTEVQNHPEQIAQNVSTAVPEDTFSEPIRNKSKNILSDLMEMSGIFDDEDMTPATEETVPAQPAEAVALPQPIFVTPVPIPVPEVERPPKLVPDTPIHLQPFIMPNVFNSQIPLPPRLKSPLGELTPITSLYELKYACANKGAFFKLDFDTGFIIPIKVCMKPTVKPTEPSLQAPKNIPIAPKSVIDLTDDDDKSEPANSPSKKSLLLLNNTLTVSTDNSLGTFSGPVKPVKLFKSLKPSILKRLNMHKMQLDTLDHKIKRKQFLRKINLNTDTDLTEARANPRWKYTRKIKVNRDLISLYKITDKTRKEPTPTTSYTEPNVNSITTILSDDDSSDDEPLAKKAKRKRENLNALEKTPNAPEGNAIAPEEITNASKGIANARESVVPVADVDTICDDGNDIIDQEAPFGFDLNDSNEEEEFCILGF